MEVTQIAKSVFVDKIPSCRLTILIVQYHYRIQSPQKTEYYYGDLGYALRELQKVLVTLLKHYIFKD